MMTEEIESLLREIFKRKTVQELTKIVAFHQSHIDLVREEVNRRNVSENGNASKQ
jgi:hypothetical protein